MSYHAGGFHAEDGAETLAAGEGGVAHGAVDGVGFGGGRGEEALERCVGEGDAGGEDFLHFGSSWSVMILRESNADGGR